MSLSVIRLQWPLLTSSFQICSGLEPERAGVQCDARGEHSAQARERARRQPAGSEARVGRLLPFAVAATTALCWSRSWAARTNGIEDGEEARLEGVLEHLRCAVREKRVSLSRPLDKGTGAALSERQPGHRLFPQEVVSCSRRREGSNRASATSPITYYCVTLISWLSLSFPEFLH